MGEPIIEYKYTTRKNAMYMVNNGFFRIGTLFDYRKNEIHSDGVADSEEGQKTLDMQGHVIDTLQPESVPDMVKPYIDEHFIAGQTILIAEQITYRSPDLYIFPTSKKYDIKLMRKINPQYDTCVEIFNTQAFYKALTDSMIAQGYTASVAISSDIIYMARIQHVKNDSRIPPHFVKDVSYRYQNEYRTVWLPREQLIEPITLICKEAKKHCRIIE